MTTRLHTDKLSLICSKTYQMNRTITSNEWNNCSLIWWDEKIFVVTFIHFTINEAWKVYKRGRGISNLVAEKAYFGIHHGFPFNGIYQKCPNFVKHRQKTPAFWSNLMNQFILVNMFKINLSRVSIFKDRDFIRIWSSK